MLLPLGPLLGIERVRKVARPVTEQQFLQAPVLERRALARQPFRRQPTQPLERAPVGIGDEAAIQVFVDVGCLLGRGPREHVGPQRARQRVVRQGDVGVALHPGRVMAPALGHRRAQRLEVADDDRRLVDVDALDRQACRALRQIFGLGEQALADRGGVESVEFAGVGREVPDDQLVLVGRVSAERPHRGEATPLGRVHAGDVQEGPPRTGTDLRHHRVLAVQPEAEVPQAGLVPADQPRQADGGTHVRQRVVCRLVRQAIGRRQALELERGPPVLVARPFDALGPQRIGAAHHVEQVPAPAAVLPFAGIGVHQVAPEQMARHLVVEADGVVAHAHRARRRQLALDGGRERVLRQALLQAGLRQDAGQQAGFRVGQEVGRGLAVVHQRWADLVEFGIGTHAGELRRPVAPRPAPEGFVVVPVEAVFAHRPQHTSSRSRDPRQGPATRRKLAKRGRPRAVVPR